MVGALVFAGILGYGVLYSGLSTFAGAPVSTLEALRGRLSTRAAPVPRPSGTRATTSVGAGTPGAATGRIRP